MALSLNKPKLDNLTNEIWKSAERLRGKFKAYEYRVRANALRYWPIGPISRQRHWPNW